jgi:hypothetical protein
MSSAERMHAGIGVGPGAQHGVDRVEAADRREFGLAALRALLVVVEGERKYLAPADEAGGPDDVLGRRVVEGADLVVGPPLAPILEPLGRRFDIGLGQLFSPPCLRRCLTHDV